MKATKNFGTIALFHRSGSVRPGHVSPLDAREDENSEYYGQHYDYHVQVECLALFPNLAATSGVHEKAMGET